MVLPLIIGGIAISSVVLVASVIGISLLVLRNK
jgi:hypothetical protein